jgi:murein DD-endopeptidase MepM/ murein hydrolase activator NlpD
VVISHPSGLESLYAHMSQIYVQPNQIVTKNSIIGTVGVTGFTTGPHTHLEVKKEGVYIDPATILPSIDEYPKTEYMTPYDTNQ